MRIASGDRSARIIDAVVVAGVAAGIGLRAWVLSSTRLGSLDSDEAVWGLMARHLLDGHWSTFFWGQNYGGSQEAILTAGLFGITGSGTLELKLVPTALYALAAVLVWRVGRRTVGEPAARIAATLFWIWPAYFVWRSTRAYGYYGSGLVLGLLVILLALRLREKPSRVDVLALGLALGLGWWATPQIVILALPPLLWLVWQRRGVLRDWWIALPAFIVGAAPWIVTNLRHDWASLHSSQARTSEFGHLHNLFTAVLPTALGLRVPFSLEWIVGPLAGWALFVLALGGFVWLLWRRPSGLGVLTLVCLVFPILYVISPYTFLSSEPRYLALFMPVLALLVARALRGPWLAAAGVAAAFALSLAGLVAMEEDRLTLSLAKEVLIPASKGPPLRVLEQAGVKTAVADYWIAYVLDFESRERIITIPVPSTGQNRHPGWNDLVRRDPRSARVFVHGAEAERHARPRLLRAGYRRIEAGGFDVYVRSGAAARGAAAAPRRARGSPRRSLPTAAVTSTRRASRTRSRATRTQVSGSRWTISW
jgi:4-amino-4-deoxy-L-arabinose transferase-like glycosyltransferase